MLNAIVLSDGLVYNTLKDSDAEIVGWTPEGFPSLHLKMTGEIYSDYLSDTECIDYFLEAMGLVDTVIPEIYGIVHDIHLYHAKEEGKFILTWEYRE